MHILFNGLMMALELAAICAVAWVGFTAPLLFAGGTALLASASERRSRSRG